MKVLIDISNIIPGKGGSGGGVAVYANNLLEQLDLLIEDSPVSIVCIKNKNNVSKTYRNIKALATSYNTSNFFTRLLWLNIYLPFYCLKNKISLLHRVVPELPLIKVGKYICTLHDLMYRFHLQKSSKSNITFLHKVKSLCYGMILRKSISSADYILVPSYFIKSEAIKVFGLNPSKIEATHLGVSKLEFDETKIRKKDVGEKFKFIVVAGFYPHKGHAKVLELAKALIKKGGINFSITFRGNPFDLKVVDKLKQEIEKNKLEDYIYFDDFKKSHDLKNIYNSFDSLLLLSEYEGFGLPVLEAQIFGLPVICSDIEIFKEVLDDSAIFVDTGDVEDSCARIINLIKDDCLRKSLIEKGFKNCERFSWRNMATETMLAYTQLI